MKFVEGYEKITREGIPAEVYFKTSPYPAAKGYKGKSLKTSFNYRFRSIEEMNNHIEGFFKSVEVRTAEKVNRRNEKKAFHTTLKKDDILCGTWGYEQTNVNFYQVVEVSPTKKTVKIREIGAKQTYNAMGMCGTKMPVPGDFTSEVMTKKVGPGWNGKGNYINIKSYLGVSNWDGSPVSYSSYA